VFQPADIHLLVARHLIVEGLWERSAVDWRECRTSAERDARRVTGGEEITIGDIRVQLAARGVQALLARAIDLELQYELSETVGIRSTLDEIEDLIEKGERVVYTSDMYLPAEQVRSMLVKAGAPAAPVFLSSEIGKTKRSGDLFWHVAEQCQVAPGQITHTGDHADSDDRIPRRLGLRTKLFKRSRPTQLEAGVYRRLKETAPLLAATLCGAMRASRLELSNTSEGMAYMPLLGTQEGALIHIGFVLWIVQQFADLSPEKIAFLARDGYLSSRIFEVLRHVLNTETPSASYTYASRQSLHLPGLNSRIMEEDLAWIMVPAQSLTFGEWLFRLGMVHGDMAGLNIAGIEVPSELSAFDDCKDACLQLLQSPDFVAVALSKSAQFRQLACDYLQPRLVSERGLTAIVDIGWNGRMQRSIVAVLSLSATDAQRIHGLYLGILRVPEGNFGSYKAWLFDLRSEPRPDCASHFQLFETLFAAPHETTYGYVRGANGEAVPKLATHDAMRGSWPTLVAYQSVIIDIASRVRTNREELNNAELAIRDLTRGAIAKMFRAPTKAQAMAFLGVGFSSDQTNLGKEQLLYGLSWWQQYRFFVNKHYQLSKNHWREGQMALATAPFLRTLYLIRSTLRLWMRGHVNLNDIVRNIRDSVSDRVNA
jgi:FMN phosphatase YigB (HAD superfamily)